MDRSPEIRITELLEANTRLHTDKVTLRNERDAWRAEAKRLSRITGFPLCAQADAAASDHHHIATAVAALEG